jgi:hypothetical protein
MTFNIINGFSISLHKAKSKNASLTTLTRKFVLHISNNDSINGDKDLILIIVAEGSKKILRISFNGNEGTDGTLKIYNPASLLLKESNFELIKYPYYASLDIGDLQTGTYKVTLTTRKSIHTSLLNIK